MFRWIKAPSFPFGQLIQTLNPLHPMSNWQHLTAVDRLDAITTASYQRPQLLFKHSTRCSISAGAKSRLDSGLNALNDAFDLHYLDLLSYREVSNAIADRFDVLHQSPQVIVVQNGKASYQMSHQLISVERILAQLNPAA
jgi:bacillithiol system protein YtxJ